MMQAKILLVGCGKMGKALLAGMMQGAKQQSSFNSAENFLIIDPKAATIAEEYGVSAIASFDARRITEFQPTRIIFAVKPQIIASILSDYRQFARQCLFISIIAGKTTAFFARYLGRDAAIIRAMPNLPVMVGEGMTVFFKNNHVTQQQEMFTRLAFKSLGAVQHVTDEALMDAVTAISGSGPAYLFYFIECYPQLAHETIASGKFDLFIECLINAAENLGLGKAVKTLAKQTVKGSLALLKQSGKSAEELRRMVTSPGGTTEAALKILLRGGIEAMHGANLKQLMVEATTAACERSKELSE